MSTNRTFDDIIKEFEEKTYEELLSLASGALSLVAKAFSNLANTERPGELILPFINNGKILVITLLQEETNKHTIAKPITVNRN